MNTRKKIVVVGAGVAGLHLGLYLVARGVDVTLVADQLPETYPNLSLLNTVAHHHVTLEREAALGIDHWPERMHGYGCHHHYVGGTFDLRFSGDFARPSRAVDYRIYLPTLLSIFGEQGGKIQYRSLLSSDIPLLAKDFDLVVVSTGKGALGRLFRPLPKLSSGRPKRDLCVGLFSGIAPSSPRGVTFSIAPGHGELIEIPVLTFSGMKTALLFETVPSQGDEPPAYLRHDKQCRPLLDALRTEIESHHPSVFERLDSSQFDFAGPNDFFRGAVTATVRESHLEFDTGKFAIALGDVHSITDPLLGQGANMASYAAEVLGRHIMASEVFDRRFCERVDLERNDRILSASRWTDLLLSPPGEEIQQLLFEMSRNRTLCNEYTENFNFPERQWDRLASPARVRAWIESRRAA
jgi:2-polyprenyl-6-methoxyphenol hydroxylase-like FAD-dependent oxidoreductase